MQLNRLKCIIVKYSLSRKNKLCRVFNTGSLSLLDPPLYVLLLFSLESFFLVYLYCQTAKTKLKPLKKKYRRYTKLILVSIKQPLIIVTHIERT